MLTGVAKHANFGLAGRVFSGPVMAEYMYHREPNATAGDMTGLMVRGANNPRMVLV